MKHAVYQPPIRNPTSSLLASLSASSPTNQSASRKQVTASRKQVASAASRKQVAARRSHPAQSGETFDGPPTLERSGSERRGGAVSSLAPEERGPG